MNRPATRPHRSTRRRIATVVVGAIAVTLGPIIASPGGATAAVERPMAVERQVDPVADAADLALTLIAADTAAGRAPSSAYVTQRAIVARLVGDRLWTDPADFVEAWAAADVAHQTAVMAALSQVGVPYRKWKSIEDVGFDCSGLTMYAWSEAGFNIPHNSTRQIRAAEPRDIFSAQAGDLLRYPGHVMMWLGVGQAIVHSPQPGQFVEVRVLADRWMRRSTFGDPAV